MLTKLEITAYKKIVGFLGGTESLASLRNWFDENSWDCGVESSDLLGSIELALAEWSNGERTPEELRSAFILAIANVGVLYTEPIVAGPLLACVTTSSSNTATVEAAPAVSMSPGRFVGRLRGMVHA
jgi:hypothetical protein